MEHELGAISQGIMRIRVTRALQSQEESMSLGFGRNGKSPPTKGRASLFITGTTPCIGVKTN
jgi:hypothetical protein